MEKLNNIEIQYLIDILNKKMKKRRYNGDSIITDNVTTHSVDIYFLIGKLEKLL
jgi:hypothetical protein